MSPTPNRASSSKSAEKAASKASRNLTPFSLAVTPSTGPPPVATNPKRSLVLDLQMAAATGVTMNLTYQILRDAVTAQTRQDGQHIYFVVEYLHVWGKLSPSASASISVMDVKYGTVSTGDNTTTDRARAGIMWPKNAQFVIAPTDPNISVFSTIFNFVAPETVTVRCGIRYWGQGT